MWQACVPWISLISRFSISALCVVWVFEAGLWNNHVLPLRLLLWLHRDQSWIQQVRNSAMMGVRKDYKRWDYDDETEITMEEQLTLEENPDSNSLGGGTDSLNSSSFPPPNIVLSSSPIRNREVKRSRKATTKEKVCFFKYANVFIIIALRLLK